VICKPGMDDRLVCSAYVATAKFAVMFGFVVKFGFESEFSDSSKNGNCNK
jgi:hypothetical protein